LIFLNKKAAHGGWICGIMAAYVDATVSDRSIHRRDGPGHLAFVDGRQSAPWRHGCAFDWFGLRYRRNRDVALFTHYAGQERSKLA
jgi:hypothetical protein